MRLHATTTATEQAETGKKPHAEHVPLPNKLLTPRPYHRPAPCRCNSHDERNTSDAFATCPSRISTTQDSRGSLDHSVDLNVLCGEKKRIRITKTNKNDHPSESIMNQRFLAGLSLRVGRCIRLISRVQGSYTTIC